MMIFLILFIISFLFNLILFLPLIIKLKRIRNKEAYVDVMMSDETCVSKVLEASMANKGKLMSFYEPTGTIIDYYFWIRKRNNLVQVNFPTSYFLFGLASYGIKNNDKIIINHVDSILDKFLTSKGDLSYELIRLDQIPIGLPMLVIDEYLERKKYSRVITQLWEFIKTRYKKDGQILYLTGTQFQHVDTIGMFVPFLCKLKNLFSHHLIDEILKQTFNEYYKYGIDKDNHLPAHGYNLTTKTKIGSINWGRGIGWYLLGASFYDEFKDTLLDQTITNLEYTQFPGQLDHFDSSTALMNEIYKRKKGLTERVNLNFIKPYIMKNGNVGSCSGDTYTYNRYSQTFGPSELCNGLLLYLSTL